eukprot:6975293-Prorocentrum_lima.AAC.1
MRSSTTWHSDQPGGACKLAYEREASILHERSGLKVPLLGQFEIDEEGRITDCLLYTSPSPRDSTSS